MREMHPFGTPSCQQRRGIVSSTLFYQAYDKLTNDSPAKQSIWRMELLVFLSWGNKMTTTSWWQTRCEGIKEGKDLLEKKISKTQKREVREGRGAWFWLDSSLCRVRKSETKANFPEFFTKRWNCDPWCSIVTFSIIHRQSFTLINLELLQFFDLHA